MINAVIFVGWEPTSTRFRPFSISLPAPLFPIGGYPMIFHHLKALSNLAEVKNVFLLGGTYDEKKFLPFLDHVRTVFNFKIHFIQEQINGNSVGALFHYKDQLLQDHPKYLFVMHCDICCSFPLHEMLKFHQSKGQLLSVMSAIVPSGSAGGKEMYSYGRFIYNERNSEIMHFSGSEGDHNGHHSVFLSSGAMVHCQISNMVNCGVYLFSAQEMYKEPVFKDYADKYARIVAISKDDHQERSLSQFFNEFANQFKLNNCTEKIQIKDLIYPLVNNGNGGSKACLFVLDQKKHFWQQVKKTKQMLYVQEIYLKYYQRVDKNILTHPLSMNPEEQIVGLVCIHPTAEVHPGAKIGPNVTIGAHARIADGVRIINSIILEDAVVQPHAVVINSIIGWSAVIGSWSRIEGLLTKNDQPMKQSTFIMNDGNTIEQSLMVEDAGGDCVEGFYHSMTGKPTCQEIYRVLKNGITTIGGGVIVDPELHLRNVVVLPFKTVNESSYHQIIV